MNQFQFDAILKIIEEGAPVLYKDLATALNNLVVERNNLDQENKDLRAQLEDLKKTSPDEAEKPEKVEVKAAKK